MRLWICGCPDCGWTGQPDELEDGACPDCGEENIEFEDDEEFEEAIAA